MKRLYFGDYCKQIDCLEETDRKCSVCKKPFCNDHLNRGLCPDCMNKTKYKPATVKDVKEFLNANASSKQTHPMYETWDILHRLEHAIEQFSTNPRGPEHAFDGKVDVSYSVEEDNELPENVICVSIYVKRKVSADEFKEWFNRER